MEAETAAHRPESVESLLDEDDFAVIAEENLGSPRTSQGSSAARRRHRPMFTVPVMRCENGHTYEAVFPASFKGTPCREPGCGKPLERIKP